MNNQEVFSVVWDMPPCHLWMVINKVHQDKPGRSSQEENLYHLLYLRVHRGDLTIDLDYVMQVFLKTFAICQGSWLIITV